MRPVYVLYFIVNAKSIRPSEYASLLSEARDYVFENGRRSCPFSSEIMLLTFIRYHGYKEGRYMLPNDEVHLLTSCKTLC